MAVKFEAPGTSHLLEETCIGFTRSSVDWDIHPEETLGTSLTPHAALGKSLPLPPFLLPCPRPAHTWMVLWEIVTVRVMAYWPDPHFFVL